MKKIKMNENPDVQRTERKNRFNEDAESEFYMNELNKLKQQLEEVKESNQNIWNYNKDRVYTE